MCIHIDMGWAARDGEGGAVVCGGTGRGARGAAAAGPGVPRA